MQAFIVYYSCSIKILAIFSVKNNIVNALTQYVYPKDSAESPKGWRKGKNFVVTHKIFSRIIRIFAPQIRRIVHEEIPIHYYI